VEIDDTPAESSNAEKQSRSESLVERALKRLRVTVGEVSAYVEVLEGSRRFQVRRDQDVLPLIDEGFEVESGQYYSYVLFTDDGELATALLLDTIPPPPAKKSNLRIANFLPEQSVMVYLVRSGFSISETPPVAPFLLPNTVSDFIEIDAENYKVVVATAVNDKVLKTVENVAVDSGKSSTLYIYSKDNQVEVIVK